MGGGGGEAVSIFRSEAGEGLKVALKNAKKQTRTDFKSIKTNTNQSSLIYTLLANIFIV